MLERILFFLFIVVFNAAYSQVEINNSIVFPDTAVSSQIKNIGTGYTSGNLVSPENLINNRHVYFNSGTYLNDTLKLITTYDFTPGDGMLFVVKCNFSIAKDTLYISINQSHTYSVITNGEFPLSKSHIKNGQVCLFQLVSNNLYLLNPSERTCPPDFTEVNEKYCIQNVERTGIFFTALSTCVNEGYRLCTWAEWYYACQKNLTGVTTMTNNWEWVNSFQSEPSEAKIVGQNRCNVTFHSNINNNRGYRCCFSK